MPGVKLHAQISSLHLCIQITVLYPQPPHQNARSIVAIKYSVMFMGTNLDIATARRMFHIVLGADAWLCLVLKLGLYRFDLLVAAARLMLGILQ